MSRRKGKNVDRVKIDLHLDIDFWTLLRHAAIVGAGCTLGIVGAIEVLWILWVVVQAVKGLL